MKTLNGYKITATFWEKITKNKKFALSYRYLDQSLIFVVTSTLIETAVCRLVYGILVMCLLLLQIYYLLLI